MYHVINNQMDCYDMMICDIKSPYYGDMYPMIRDVIDKDIRIINTPVCILVKTTKYLMNIISHT